MLALVESRKVGLPLEMAATIAGVDPTLAAEWLAAGRLLRKLDAKRPPLEGYRQLCQQLAIDWDRAVPGIIGKLREYLLIHALKDPKACVQALQSYEREYHLRRPHVARAGVDEIGADLAETFLPLELASAAAPARSARFTKQNADGSYSSAEFTEGPAEGFEADVGTKTDAELEHFATHGEWPLPPPKARAIDGTIDALGEAVDVAPDYAELTLALSGEPPKPEVGAPPRVKTPTARPPLPLPVPAPPPAQLELRAQAPTPPPTPPLRRVPGHEGLRELGAVPGRQVVTSAPVAPAPPKAPAHAPLRRVEIDR